MDRVSGSGMEVKHHLEMHVDDGTAMDYCFVRMTEMFGCSGLRLSNWTLRVCPDYNSINIKEAICRLVEELTVKAS